MSRDEGDFDSSSCKSHGGEAVTAAIQVGKPATSLWPLSAFGADLDHLVAGSSFIIERTLSNQF